MDARAINLGVRFVLELVALVAFAIWGLNASSDLLVRLVLGIGVPVGVMAVWATFVSPRAPRRLADPARLVVEAGVFALAVVALWLVGLALVGVVLAVAASLSLVLMVAWEQRGL